MNYSTLLICTLLAYAIGNLTYKLIRITMDAIVEIKEKLENEKIFKEKSKEVEAMKKEGGHHKWMEMAIGTKTHLVCENTGWCPELEGFVNMPYIEQIKKQKAEHQKYLEYRKTRIKELAKKYRIGFKSVEHIVDSAFDIKKQWAIQKIAKAQEKAKKK